MSDKPVSVSMLECVIPSTVLFHPLEIHCGIIIVRCNFVVVMYSL